jgi:hypothetical protein
MVGYSIILLWDLACHSKIDPVVLGCILIR